MDVVWSPWSWSRDRKSRSWSRRAVLSHSWCWDFGLICLAAVLRSGAWMVDGLSLKDLKTPELTLSAGEMSTKLLTRKHSETEPRPSRRLAQPYTFWLIISWHYAGHNVLGECCPLVIAMVVCVSCPLSNSPMLNVINKIRGSRSRSSQESNRFFIPRLTPSKHFMKITGNWEILLTNRQTNQQTNNPRRKHNLVGWSEICSTGRYNKPFSRFFSSKYIWKLVTSVCVRVCKTKSWF